MRRDDIPIIDIQALRARDERGSRIAANELGEACKRIGFFYVKGHGIPDALIEKVFSNANAFFSLPLEQKLALSMEKNSRCFRGYAPVLSELADGKRNSYELMEFSVDVDANHPDALAGKPMHGPNIWPAIPGYRSTITTYVDSMVGLGFDLMRGIAISLDLEEDFFYKAFNGRSFWQFRTTHYPEPTELARMSAANPQTGPVSDVEIGDYSCGAHTDYGCLTILLANNSGLQVLNLDGKWLDAPMIPGTFICNIGDMLQYWTADLYRATLHRVLSTQSRISLPFFFQPDYDTVVEPIRRTDRAQPAVKYGPYAYEKFKGIYPNSKLLQPLDGQRAAS